MQRIMIVGQPGAGKSTLARRLAARTGLPVVHMDHIHWQPGWVERDRAERTRLTLEATAREEWIFEGGFSATWPQRLARAELLIWIDIPVGPRLWRVWRRSLVHLGRARADLPEGCVERLDRGSLEFWHYIWRTRRIGRAAMARLAGKARAQGVPVVELRSLHAVEAWLKGPEAPGARSG